MFVLEMQKTFLSQFAGCSIASLTLTILNMFALLPINPLLSLIIGYLVPRAKNVRQIATLIGYLRCKTVPDGSCPLGLVGAASCDVSHGPSSHSTLARVQPSDPHMPYYRMMQSSSHSVTMFTLSSELFCFSPSRVPRSHCLEMRAR